jgi:hypothetical protein
MLCVFKVEVELVGVGRTISKSRSIHDVLRLYRCDFLVVGVSM